MEQQVLTPEQKEFLIDQALQTEEGRIALASSMANPIRLTLDYQGIGRKLLVVDPLPQGALPVYDKDVKIPVVVIGKRGQAPDTIVEGERITVGTWEIISYPQVRFSQVKERRYNLIDRAQQRAKLDLMAEEDRNIFNAIDRSSTILNPETLSGTTTSRDALVAGLAEIGKWDLVPARFIMNYSEFADIMKFGRDQFDPVTQREVLQTGLVGHLWTLDKKRECPSKIQLYAGKPVEYSDTIKGKNSESVQIISREDRNFSEPPETTCCINNIRCPICNRDFNKKSSLSMHLGSKKDFQHSSFYKSQINYIVEQYKNTDKSIWDIEKDNRVFLKKSIISKICKEKLGMDFMRKKSQQNKWCKGLTKEIDIRILNLSKKISKALKGRKITWGNKVSQTRKIRIANGDIIVHNKNKNMNNYEPLKRMSETRINKILKGQIRFTGGNSNRGFRQDLNHYFRSSLESNFARILNYKNISFGYEIKRYSVILDNNKLGSYLPDFWINGKIYELKGYLDKKTENKIKCFEKQYGLKINIIQQKSDLWKWLENRYNKLIPKWEYYKRYSPNFCGDTERMAEMSIPVN